MANVLGDILFQVSVAASAVASRWIYEAILTTRINEGVRTPIYVTEGFCSETILKNGPYRLGLLLCLAWIASHAQPIANTGFDAEAIVVSKGKGQVWRAGNQCEAHEGIDRMIDGPAGVWGAYASGLISEDDMPIALLAQDIYSGRVPDNGARVEHVVAGSNVLSDFAEAGCESGCEVPPEIGNRAFFTSSGRPIIEMPHTIPLKKTEAHFWGSYMDGHAEYKGDAFEPDLEAVSIDQVLTNSTNKIWGAYLTEHVVENGRMYDTTNGIFDFNLPEEISQGKADGFSYYQYPPLEVGDDVHSDFHILVVLEESTDELFRHDFEIPSDVQSWISHEWMDIIQSTTSLF